MLEENRTRVEGKAATGIPSCALDVDRMAAVIELWKNPPVGGAIA